MQILVVDNNLVFTRLISEILKKRGYSVKTAEDGLDALLILEGYIPDLIFTDLVMPKISGEILCRAIRSKKHLDNTYIVVVSAIAIEAELNLDELGIDACIAKEDKHCLAPHVNAVLDKIEEGTLRKDQPKNFGFENSSIKESTVELLNAKKHLDIVLANMSDGLVEVSSEGTVIYLNPVAEILLSMPQPQLLGRNFFEFFQEEDYQNAITLFKNAQQNMQEGSSTRDFTLNNRLVTLHIQPLDGCSHPSSIVIIQDITERKELENKLKLLASTDQLTGLYNRRAFDNIFSQGVNRMKRYDEPLAFIFFDIDLFKKVNDNFGHNVGDQVLQQVVKIVREQIREVDYFIRWGGDEFLLLLPNTNLSVGQNAAERVREAVENCDLPIPWKLTISIGVSQFSPDESAETLIKRTDKALREAKRGGRNHVVSIPTQKSD